MISRPRNIIYLDYEAPKPMGASLMYNNVQQKLVVHWNELETAW